MAQSKLNPDQIEWLANNMPHFGEMFLTNVAVRKDEVLYKQGYLHHRNRIFVTGRCTPIQLANEHQRDYQQPAITRLPLFERIATVK